MDFIPFLKPNVVAKDAYAVYVDEIDASHIYSNYGPLNARFEERVVTEQFGGVGAAVTVNNATSGLMLAISQTMRGGGKYALMPSFTFAATPLAAMWCGLTPYFLDADPDTWLINEEQLQDALEHLGEQVAVVVPYATFGTRLDLGLYTQLQRTGTPVVVDAAASFGCTKDGVHFGRGFPGTVVFSFHATKSFGVGEGGLVYSGDTDLVATLRRAGNFGFDETREAVTLGFNSKMSEYTAAVALATLDVYSEKKCVRQVIYRNYLDCLDSLNATAGWRTQKLAGSVPHQFFPILCPKTTDNTCFVNKLARANVQARTYFSPACHQQSYFETCPHADLSVTDALASRVLSLPLYETMNLEQVQRVVEALG